MSNHVEYIGGPKDGIIDNLGQQTLPREIVVAGRPADWYATAYSAVEEIPDHAERMHLAGTYRFVRLHWSPLHPETQLGDYAWEGWE